MESAAILWRVSGGRQGQTKSGMETGGLLEGG